ncbi:MAG: helix-turn-helix domain-containing protein [Eubacterium callanderi]|uniref:helix-turn-helix domain-containing protein n=1 Tax=Eubacterium callanderi TaxID=53442 RepID=UPI00399568E5
MPVKKIDGVTRLGIEALALKLQGMRITDIAELYQVPPSHVGAWISRSTAKLRRDTRFLKHLL